MTGWRAEVPVLREWRGSAPATVAALQGGNAGTLERPGGPSIGAHGLTRALPAGLCTWWQSPGALGASLAALSHGGSTLSAAALGVTMIYLVDLGNSVAGAPRAPRCSGPFTRRFPSPNGNRCGTRCCSRQPPAPSTRRRWPALSCRRCGCTVVLPAGAAPTVIRCATRSVGATVSYR